MATRRVQHQDQEENENANLTGTTYQQTGRGDEELGCGESHENENLTGCGDSQTGRAGERRQAPASTGRGPSEATA